MVSQLVVLWRVPLLVIGDGGLLFLLSMMMLLLEVVLVLRLNW